MKLSIGMIVKNEEKNLERCLSSLRPLMKAIPSELIIVDTGSTDNTAAIASGYTDQVYFHPWENDYAKMRNFTVNYARGAWFFFIDADEELVEYDAIVDFLTGEKSRQYHAASVKVNSLYRTGDARQFATASVTRLFRRTKTFRFEGAIHEQPVFDPPIFMLDAVLIHHGYVIDNPELKERKLQLYEPILRQALERNPLDVHFWYQLSRTYVSYKNAQIALEPAVKAYEIIKKQKLKPSEYLYVYVNLAYLYLVNGSPLKAADIAEEGLKVKEWVVDLWFYLEKAQAMLKKYEEAIRSCKKYIYYADDYDSYISQDIRMVSFTLSGREEAHLDLSVLYKETGRNQEAVDELLKIESAEILKKAAAHGVALFAGMQDFGMLEGFYRKIKSEDMTSHFCQALERYLLDTKGGQLDTKGGQLDTKGGTKEIYRIFEQEDTNYGILNRIRLSEDAENADPCLREDLGKLALSELDYYYGDIFYFIIKGKLPFDLIDRRISEEKLNRFFQYLNTRYDDLSEAYFDYLQNCQKDCTLEESRIRKIMRRSILLADSLEDFEYEQVLNGYIEDGITCIRQIYNTDILTGGSTHLLRSNEEAFFLYLDLARQAASSDQAAYVRNLKNALQSCPEMKKGIEILLKRVTDKIDSGKKHAIVSELEAYAQIVKENIKQLVDQNMFREAGELILGYEQIIPHDPDIDRIKALMDANS